MTREQLRQLLPRTLVVAVLVGIIPLLGGYFGYDSLVGSPAEVEQFANGNSTLHLHGTLRSAPGALHRYHVDLTEPGGRDAQINLVRVSGASDPRVQIYIGRKVVSAAGEEADGGLLAVRGSLELTIQKASLVGGKSFSYSATVERQPLEDASSFNMTGGVTYLRAQWLPDGNLRWKLHVQGKPGQSGRVMILVPSLMSVAGSWAFGDGLEASIGAPGQTDPPRICLDSALALQGYDAVSQLATAASTNDLGRVLKAELDLQDSQGLDILLQPVEVASTANLRACNTFGSKTPVRNWRALHAAIGSVGTVTLQSLLAAVVKPADPAPAATPSH